MSALSPTLLTSMAGAAGPPGAGRPATGGRAGRRTAATQDADGRRIVRLHGSRRQPLEASVEATRRRWGYQPHHRVISRGLLDDPATSDGTWERVAAHLDDLRAGIAPVGGAETLAVLRAADRHGVLTYDQSLAAATDAARSLVPAGAVGHAVELWHADDGHTASVWRILVRSADGTPLVDAAANVARDLDAERELVTMAQHLWRATSSGAVAAPVRVAIHGGTTVVLQPWLAGAAQLHPVAGPDGTRLAAARTVEERSGDGGTGRWRPLSLDEHRRVGHAAARVLAAHPALTFSADEGDWVLHRGEAVLVACDDRRSIPFGAADAGTGIDAALGITDPGARRALRAGAAEARTPGPTRPRRSGG